MARLDEAVWLRAVPAAGFLQQDPDNGAPVTERTEVRVLFDRENLYLGVWCFDSEPDRAARQPDAARSALRRRRPVHVGASTPSSTDAPGTSSRSTRRARWATASSGPVSGGNVSGEVNKSWDGIWLARVRRTDEGWFAEMQIPFRTVNFDPDAQAWGINFQRTVRRKNEESLWTGHARNQGLTRISSAGRLEGI